MQWLFALALLVSLAGPVAAQPAADIETVPTEELVRTASLAHPITLYMLSARLLEEERGLEAAQWLYAGQLRYRFLLAALGEQATDERVLFSALTESVGRPVNEYIAGDPDEWMAAMQWALDWDAAHDNLHTSKQDFAADLARVRAGLDDLIQHVDQNREQIRKTRAANGLPNR